ncbi:MAG: deoxyribonuclease IV [Ignavibacteria bacterium CG_4_9_14_3_um_filter_36_18]|nr:MAG: deoxyribonuclease IV [Ignavibacteria bacterium CG_4_9_14_3_um_filter_36_18]
MSKRMSIHNQLLGAHTSAQGGVSKAVELAERLGFTAMQIFSKNNNRWAANQLDEKEVALFKEKLSASNIKFVVVHDSYLINLCSSNEELLNKSRDAYVDELMRCEKLGIKHLNFHPGAYGTLGEEKGIQLVADSLNFAHAKTPDIKVSSMIELTAGQGTSLGYSFGQVKKIIDLVEDKCRVSVCIDTAHIFAAGYNIRDASEYKKVIKEFDDVIGLETLKCIHMNDSKKPLGSRVDRHEHIGKGFIGLEGFANIMNDKKIARVPKILETPKGKECLEDLENLEVLRGLIEGNKT